MNFQRRVILFLQNIIEMKIEIYIIWLNCGVSLIFKNVDLIEVIILIYEIVEKIMMLILMIDKKNL